MPALRWRAGRWVTNCNLTFLLKQQAAGRWPEILSALGGCPAEILDGKHHPCPKCGGKDRFRMIDQEAGALYCNQCGKGLGDGIAALTWLCGWDFKTALAELAKYLGIAPATAAHSGSKSKIVATYDYRNESGELLYQVVRYHPKDFRQRRPKPSGGWVWSVKGCRMVPYHLSMLLAAAMTHVMLIVEGEKDVERAERLGIVATCNAMGAGKWWPEYNEHFRGRLVCIIPDNDKPGREHAQQVAQSLHGIAQLIKIVELPGVPEHGDLSDWLDQGHTKDELRAITKAAPEWKPGAVQPWPKITSFDELDLPDFPTYVLPDPLRNWAEAESYATQTPADLAGLLALAVCSAAIARRVVVVPRPGWREPVNMFVAVLLEPGNRKSAVFEHAMRPLRELEAELIEAARPAVARTNPTGGNRKCGCGNWRNWPPKKGMPKRGTKPTASRRNWPSKPSRFCLG